MLSSMSQNGPKCFIFWGKLCSVGSQTRWQNKVYRTTAHVDLEIVFWKESSMKIKTLAIVVLSALSLSSTAALADTTPTTVNGGTVHFKGKLLTPLAQLMQALLIKPFSWARFVPPLWSRLEQPALLSVLTFSWMIAIPLLPQKPLLPSWGRRLTVLILKSWLYRVQLRVAQQTLACRFWTEQVMSWRWTVRHLVQKQPWITVLTPFRSRRVILQPVLQPQVLLMRMRPSGSVSITYQVQGRHYGQGCPPLCDKNNDEKEEIISVSVVAANVCSGRK